MAALTSGGGEPFTFSAGEQAFYQEKGFTNEPGRCPACRRANKASRAGGSRSSYSSGGYAERSERTMYPATCSECGKETTVPFAPSGEKPVYCSDCFQKGREQRSYSRY
jgi:CxxC-x17-CxxC domain-containing protein